MSDEDTQPVEETTEEVEDTTDEVDDTESVEENSQEESDDVDFKAEYERYKREAETKGRKIRELRKEMRERDTEPESDDDSADDIGVKALVRKELSRIEQMRVQDTIEDVLEETIDNRDERELTRAIYENDLQPSGFTKSSIKDDLKKARILANMPKYEADIERRVRKSVAQKEAMQKTAKTKGSVNEPEVKDRRKLSRADREFDRSFRRALNLTK